MLVQYQWHSKSLSYHLYTHYYLNLVETWKSLTYLVIHFCHLRFDTVFLLEAKIQEILRKKPLKSQLKEMSNSMIQVLERNTGTVLQATAPQLFEAKPFFMDLHLL